MPKKGARLPWRLSFVWVDGGIKGAHPHHSRGDAERAAREMFTTARQRDSELTITILNRDTGEDFTMTANDALTEEITANIERISSLAEVGNADGVEELVTETEELIKQISGRGSAALKGNLTAKLKAASEGQPEESDGDADGKGAAEVETGETPIEGVVIPPEIEALVEKGAEAVLEAIGLGLKMRKIGVTVFQIMLTMRKESEYNNLPDLMALGKVTRINAGLIYKRVNAALAPEDVDKADTLKELQRAVQNKSSDVLVEYLRGLDVDKEAGLQEVTRFYPDAAAAYLKAKEKETEEAPASLTEAVYELYASEGIELPRKGRTELERERRAALKALEGQSKPDESKLTPAVRQKNYLDTIKESLAKTKKNATKLTAAQKRKTRDELQKLADAILALKAEI